MNAPVGRPPALSGSGETSRVRRDAGPVSAAKDLPNGSSPTRISARRLEAIAEAMSAEDRAVMAFLGEVRLATGFQLARRLWAASAPTDPRARRARRTLARLEQLRVIQRLGRSVGGVRGGSSSIVYGLGPAGRRLLNREGLATRLGTPGDRHVRHTLAITELAVRLHEATLAGQLELLEVQTEPACWRRFTGALGARVTLKPDCYLRLAAGRGQEDRWFVEVDRATEAAATIRAKATRYLDHLRSGVEQAAGGVYPRVLWSVPDTRRAAQLVAILSGLPDPAPQLFAVWCADEVVGRLAAEARL